MFESTTAKASLVVTVLGAITASLVFFDTYGWITRSAYAKDHEISIEDQLSQQTQILQSLSNTLVIIKNDQEIIKAEQANNQDQWECDETDEELEEFLMKAEIEPLTAKELREQEKAEELWTALDCSRFTD